MPNKKITAMPSLAGNQVPTDLVTAVDLSAAPVNQNVKSTLNDLFAVITKNITDRAIRFQAPGSAPAVSSASQGALYHNGTAFLASSNGGAYEPVYTLSAQSAAVVFAGPTSGPAATPTFRALALTDLPAGIGTVTSVGLSAPSFLNVANSPVTGSGTLALSLATQSAALVFAGPTSGPAATPTFRALALTDLPAGIGTVTSVGLSAPSFLNVANSPVTGSGTLALSLATQSAALVFAGPTSGPAATPTFRALALTDLPQIATASLLGRISAGTGSPEQITSTAALLTWLQSPISNNLSAAVTDSTGVGGALVFSNGPVLTNPRLDFIGATTANFGTNLLFSPTLNAVNFLEILNAVSGSGPTIRPTGLSANQPLNLSSRGTGIVSVTGNQLRVTGNTSAAAGILELRGGDSSLSGGQIRLYEITTNGTNYIGFQAPDLLNNNVLFELPNNDGAANQALSTNGSSILTWRSYNQAGYKNLIINGDMAICQRTANFLALNTSGYHTVDRWRTEIIFPITEAGHYQQDWDIDTPTGQGFFRSLAMTCTNSIVNLSPSVEVRIEQRIEGVNLGQVGFATSNAKNLSVSFWVKSSVTGTFVVELIQPAGQGPAQVSASYTIINANTWEKKTVTFPPRTSGGAFLFNTSYQLALGFWLAAGSNFTGGGSLQTIWGNTANRRAVGSQQIDQLGEYWKITGVQLEASSVSTDFEFLPYQTSYNQCLRYYYSNRPSGNFTTFLSGVGPGGSTTQAIRCTMPFPVPMRGTPTATIVGVQVYNGFQVFPVVGVGNQYNSTVAASMDLNVTGVPQAGSQCQVIETSSSSRINYDAEI